MAQDDLFSAGEQFEVDPNKNYYEELVGENKKFKDNEALARTVFYKDQHISTLEAERAREREQMVALQQQIQGQQKLEDLVEKLAQAREGYLDNSRGNQSEREISNTPALTAEQLDQLISQKLTQTQESVKRTANQEEVKKVCADKLGPNYSAKLQQQATSLGMSKDFLNNLAGENPKAFYKLMGLEDTKQDSVFSPQSTINTSGMAPVSNTKATEEFYNNMRKEKPELYRSPKIQGEIYALERRKIAEMGLDKYLESKNK